MKIAKYKREKASVERMGILKDLIAKVSVADEAGVEVDNEEEVSIEYKFSNNNNLN
jgi:hypothetical protein